LAGNQRSAESGDPVRRRRRFYWGLLLGGWTLVGVLFVGPSVVDGVADKTAIPWREVASRFFGCYLWALLSPLIWRWTRRRPFERRSWPQWLGLNLGLGLAVAAFYVVLALVKDATIDALAAGEPGLGALRLTPRHFFAGIAYYLLVYFAIVAVFHAISFAEKYRERELAASRLEGQLTLAQLEMLKAQLHPHFLFNTLNAISALMHRDVDAADRMITMLSDLLRLSIDKDDRHQVPLQSEIEFLERYLAIERVRFRDRLAVDIDVEPECLRAQVPKLILQPLVENAIRHGIAMRSAAGRVAVRARRQGERVVLEVADDGPGLPARRALREGIGLGNTRARLEQLYPGDHRFELGTAETGGMKVVMEIPFEQEARFPVS
jgi:two-component system LytT family sensor kinase